MLGTRHPLPQPWSASQPKPARGGGEALVYLVAGEQSGDVLGGRLMAALKQARPGLEFAGIGGPMMEAEGLAPLFPMRELAVMGLAEILPRVLRLRRRLRETAADALMRRPDVLVTIDS